METNNKFGGKSRMFKKDLDKACMLQVNLMEKTHGINGVNRGTKEELNELREKFQTAVWNRDSKIFYVSFIIGMLGGVFAAYVAWML